MNNDLISRSALFNTWDALDETQDPNLLVDAMIKATQEAPAVDAEPVRHGVWKPVMLKNVFGQEFVYRHACSICHEYTLCECANYDAEEELSNYCPNCGAKMDGDEHAAD